MLVKFSLSFIWYLISSLRSGIPNRKWLTRVRSETHVLHMALLEEYYELNEAEEVSAGWKIIQIIFYAIAACLGLWCGYTMALLRLKFGDKCYLFTSVEHLLSNGTKIDGPNLNWENDSRCDFCQYSMVSSFIVATIWATFYLMCGKGGKSLTGLPQPWRIVLPSLIFNIIYFIVALSTAINIQKGTDEFCTRNFNKEIQTRALVGSCEPLKALPEKDLYITSLQLEIVAKTSWGCTVSWLILFLIPFFRIVFVIDFHMYKICVFKIDDTIQNKKEEVLRITNYEEPKKLHLTGSTNMTRASEYKEKLKNLEKTRKETKNTDEKIIREHFDSLVSQPPIQRNTVVYVTRDLRMLSREKKIIRTMDNPFRKNQTHIKCAKSRNQTLVKFTDLGNTELPSTLYLHGDSESKHIYNSRKEENSSSVYEKKDIHDEWSESASGSDDLEKIVFLNKKLM